MDEARRFLRYVIPSLSFAVQTILLLFVLIPPWVQKQIAVLISNKGIGIALAALLGSGGVGFVFSLFHHEFHWRGPNWQWLAGQNHIDLIERLRDRKLLCLLDAQNGNALALDSKPDRFEAWAIFNSLWHERLETNNKIKSADPRADSLANSVHSIGTARVASFFAVILAFGITCHVSEYSSECWDIVHFISAIVIAVVLLYLHQSGYRRTGLVAQRVVEQVLTDALADEASSGPVQTYVVLKQRTTANRIGPGEEKETG